MVEKSSMQQHLKLARFLAVALDSQFNIGGFRFGIGPIIGIIPGLGDVIENALSFYLVWIGTQMDIPTRKLAEMLGNIGFNFLLALIPVIGNIGDFAFKSNLRNLKILEEYAKNPIVEGEVVEEPKKEVKKLFSF